MLDGCLHRVALKEEVCGIGPAMQGKRLAKTGEAVEGISDELTCALVAGAVAGGGLTVIANAPSPAGVGILQDAKVFAEEGISPPGTFPWCAAAHGGRNRFLLAAALKLSL
jgi:hypothetical protein